MAYLYTPPTTKQWMQILGSLRYYVDTSTTVYRSGGTWHQLQNPGIGVVESADVITAGDWNFPFRLYFNKPTVVPDSLFAELTAFGIGTLTQL